MAPVAIRNWPRNWKRSAPRHSDYSHVLNGRFKGGHITRHYGNPAENIHAVQLELCQSTYMEEFEPFRYRADLAEPTRVVLKELLQGLSGLGRKALRQRLTHPSVGACSEGCDL